MEVTEQLWKTMKRSNKLDFIFSQMKILNKKLDEVSEKVSFVLTKEFKKFVMEFPEFLTRFNHLDNMMYRLMKGMKEDGILPKDIYMVEPKAKAVKKDVKEKQDI